VALVALLVRGLVAMPRNVPTESMLPGLVPGDYVMVARWRLGWSHTSLPFGWPRLPGRWFARPPVRGDVLVFRVAGNDSDYVKRLIGLPGDTVALHGGQVVLNGTPVPRRRTTDFLLPLGPRLACAGPAQPPYGATPEGQCRLPRFVETLPGGRSYAVIDQGHTPQDDLGPFTVPAAHYFLLGDNRDASADSRFPAGGASGGIGMVAADDVEGPAVAVLLSADGSARWWQPWRWLAALRPGRALEAVR